MTLLLIDDDPALLSVMHEILTAEGYQVFTAIRGADALTLMDQKNPALVFFGNRVPDEIGEAFVVWLKQRDPPPLVVAMASTREALQWAEQIGADEFLAKPFDASELLATVRRLSGTPADLLC